MKLIFVTAFIVAVVLRLISEPKYDFDFLGAWAIFCGAMIIFLTTKGYWKKKSKK
jgi:hypothetical protein